MSLKNQIDEIKITSGELVCYHCGETCPDDSIKIGEKLFCCNGCKTVYEILEANDLCDYYSIESTPGVTKKKETVRNFDFLDDAQFIDNFVEFKDNKITSVLFNLPQIHCSSCIWILENLNKLNEGIIFSRADFLKKQLQVKFLNEKTNLKEVVLLLDQLGYTPDLSLEKDVKPSDKKLYYQLGVAGFAFGNIMLLSFPEYLTSGAETDAWLKQMFGYLSFVLALPVLFYSSLPYFLSAYKGLTKKIVNIDVPISLGIIVLFLRSAVDVFTHSGSGYFDSFAGLIFFLLLGKLFQSKTYEALNFERTYKSYFPVSIIVKRENTETSIPLEKLKTGERIIAKNNEIIPADSVLLSDNALIDYSFVTGESVPVEVVNGDVIYAGGKNIASSIELETVKDVSQSYLTKLWKHSAFRKDDSALDNLTNKVSKYFTFVILAIALIAGLIWLFIEPSHAVNVITAVLIVACPCALALSTPFTMGNSLRIFGRNKFYLKSVHIIEKLAGITDIVFDKTGTITQSGKSKIEFSGSLSDEEKVWVISAVSNSSHPLSRGISNLWKNLKLVEPDYYKEIAGSGIEAKFNGNKILIGSINFIMPDENELKNPMASEVHVSINGEYKGKFVVQNVVRTGFGNLINKLAAKFKISLISGDTSGDKVELQKYFPKFTLMLFQQSPHNKLEFIKNLQLAGRKVMMIGDGLNDAGALAQADVGISISDDVNNFSPACDGILEGKNFNKLPELIFFSKTSKNIIIISFVISFLYNLIGLSFAVSGQLSPLIAAILMPLSSISVVVFATVATNLMAKKQGLL